MNDDLKRKEFMKETESLRVKVTSLEASKKQFVEDLKQSKVRVQELDESNRQLTKDKDELAKKERSDNEKYTQEVR